MATKTGKAAKKKSAGKGTKGRKSKAIDIPVPIPPGRTFYVTVGSNIGPEEIRALMEAGKPVREVNLKTGAVTPWKPEPHISKVKKKLAKKTLAAGVIYTLNAPFKVGQAA